MTENDNRLLEQFFQEAAVQQIEDNGFSNRVMEALRVKSLELSDVTSNAGQKSLNTKLSTLNTLWTFFCIAVAGVLFFVLQGWQSVTQTWQIVLTYMEVLLRTLAANFSTASFLDFSSAGISFSLLQLAAVAMVLMILSVIGISRWAIRLEL